MDIEVVEFVLQLLHLNCFIGSDEIGSFVFVGFEIHAYTVGCDL